MLMRENGVKFSDVILNCEMRIGLRVEILRVNNVKPINWKI